MDINCVVDKNRYKKTGLFFTATATVFMRALNVCIIPKSGTSLLP